jgi:hypothetical protein
MLQPGGAVGMRRYLDVLLALKRRIRLVSNAGRL